MQKLDEPLVYGVTSKLLTKPDGSKFGKSEEGTVWLDPTKTSPYDFYQFWRNTPDSELRNYLSIFTMLDEQQIGNVMNEHNEAPNKALGQRMLAMNITTMVHGWELTRKAIDASRILFDWREDEELGDISLDAFIGALEKQIPTTILRRDQFQTGISVQNLLLQAGIFKTKGEAMRMCSNGGVYVNNVQKLEASYVTLNDLVKDHVLLVRIGKKQHHLIVVP